MRIAIINADKCKPKKCGLECKRFCPLTKQDKMCVEVQKTSKSSKISEILCIGCGICVKKCPFEAIKIIKVKNLPAEVTHKFGENRFRIHKLPTPRPGNILGLVGTNGIGKSTALQILTKKIIPNMGDLDHEPNWESVIQAYKGTEIQAYFDKLVKNEYTSAFKVQFVDKIPKKAKGKVFQFLNAKNQKDPETFNTLIKLLEMDHLLDRRVGKLSGGEL